MAVCLERETYAIDTAILRGIVQEEKLKTAAEADRADYYRQQFREASNIITWPNMLAYQPAVELDCCRHMYVVVVAVRPTYPTMHVPLRDCTVVGDVEKAAKLFEESAWMIIEQSLREDFSKACREAAVLLAKKALPNGKA